ncbi:phosphatase PAP2 family protein [Amycolatopsis sp. NBC_00348]|uniref:phosphatase PAP2 family protein n=1 Tax=Amycolatopsis sp. NBC_00348 TaxID=2975956 RepID=UPI002E275157
MMSALSVPNVWLTLGRRLGFQVARPRPPTADRVVRAGGLSFPSGHTSDAALAAGLIAWLVVRRFTGRVTARVVWPIAAAYALLIAWTRVYLGVHWPTDVLGSLAFVTTWLSGALVLQRLDERETSHRA